MKTSLTTVFADFLKHENLESQKLLLLVSGGVDSVVLLHVATQVVAAENLAVFHLNHNARLEAEEDQIFVQNLCAELNIKFYTHTLNPDPSKTASNKSRDQENQWRQQRQRLSQQAKRNFGAQRMLTAHHATDLVETMLFRLTKGAGPNGLSPFDTSTKPFWSLPKQALLDYAAKHALNWQEDPSNLNTNFERNLIRAEVLPPLRKITPNLEPVFVRESKTFATLFDFLQTELAKQAGPFLAMSSIPLDTFLNLHSALQTELLRTIAQQPTSQSEVEDCLKWLQSNPEGGSTKLVGATKIILKSGALNWKD